MKLLNYFKWIEVEVGRARSEKPVNLLLGGQHRVPLLNLLHLNTKEAKQTPEICFLLMPLLLFWFSAALDPGIRRKGDTQ